MKRIKINWFDFLRNSALLLMVAIVIILASFLRTAQKSLKTFQDRVPAISTASLDDQRWNIVLLTNKVRLDRGINPLHEDMQLTKSAQKKACDMVERGYYDHVSPDGLSPWIFFTQEGYKYFYAGENLARGYYTDQSVVDAWMKSPDHKANIVNSHYTDIGIGICGLYIVQHFGSLSLGSK